MKTIARTVSALAIFLFAALPIRGQSVRTFVASSGSDTNPCTRQLPCRNFAAAITAVSPEGEVVALDSAGYGPVAINKSVSLVAPPAVHAAIVPTSGSAITISASSIFVLIRGLTLSGLGAAVGVDVPATSVDSSASIEDMNINNFVTAGVRWSGPNGDAHLRDLNLRQNGTGAFFTAVTVDPANLTRATLERVRIEEGTDGLMVGIHSLVHATDIFTSHHSNAGIYNNGGTLIVVRGFTETNFYGILNQNARTVVSATSIMGNNTGLSHTGLFGVTGITSLSDNRLTANFTDGTFQVTATRY